MKVRAIIEPDGVYLHAGDFAATVQETANLCRYDSDLLAGAAAGIAEEIAADIRRLAADATARSVPFEGGDYPERA